MPTGRALVAALAVTQTVGYGTLYYAFAVFLVPVSAALHASTTAVTGTFTAAVLASAVLAVLAAIQAALTVPLHLLVVRAPPHPPGSRTSLPASSLRTVVTDPGFWLLGVSFTANTAAIAVVTVHLVAALISWGHPAPFA